MGCACEAGLEHAEDAEAAEVNWQELAGRRLRRSLRFLSCPSQRFAIRALCVVLEPLRIMHSRYMNLANHPRGRRVWPGLLTETNRATSVVVKVLQFYSSLLCGAAERGRLVWQWSDCPSMLHWIRAHTQDARLLRRLILSAASEAHRRFSKITSQFPWLLLGLADNRRDDHQDILSKFYSTPPCCKPPGFARDIQLRGVTADELMSDSWMQFLYGAASAMAMSIASVEKRHAFHRRVASKDLQWHNFSGISVLEEAKQQYQAWRSVSARSDALGSDDNADALQPACERLLDRKPQKRRAQTALRLFWAQWLEDERVCGRRWNPASASTWAACRAAYHSLDPAIQSTYAWQAAAGPVNYVCKQWEWEG